MARKKIWRKDTLKTSRLGSKNKKLRKWRRAKGKHSKVREKRRGYLASPEIGYKKSARTLVSALKPKIIYGTEELKKITSNEIAVIGKVGKKKKIELAKAADELKIKILNLNVKKFLRKVEKEKSKKKTIKGKEETKAEKKEKAEKPAERAKAEEKKPEAEKIEKEKIMENKK